MHHLKLKCMSRCLIFKRNASAYSKKWLSVVGLEVHAQISSSSKLFSSAGTKFNTPVNCNVSLFDCSIPGTLPVLNRRCVEAGVFTAAALNCKINPISMFDRKHYFYADLPAGYQITQQRAPLANDGYLTFHVYSSETQKKSYSVCARLKQLQLEQDSGKSLHDSDRSLVDLNRVGIPLMELVFEPDLKNGEEAAALVKELILILQRLNTCSCKMEEGALRVDANVSVHKKGEPLGVRSEVKNIGSVRGVAAAINYEIDRQIKILESGGRVINETRAWDATTKSTLAMRDKEQQQDYRYMPEPNLPPLHLAVGPIKQGVVNVDTIKSKIPELPNESRTKLVEESKLTIEQAITLVNENTLYQMFREASTETQNTKLLANLIINDFLETIHKENKELESINVQSKCFKDIIEMLEENMINRKTAKMVLREIIDGDLSKPKDIVKKHDWAQISDDEELKRMCIEVIKENTKMLQDYKRGKTKVFKAFLGIISNKSKQKANMNKCATIMKKLLDDS